MKPNDFSPLDDDADVGHDLPTENTVVSAGAKSIARRSVDNEGRTFKIHPSEERSAYPRALLDFAYNAAREGFVRTASMGAALNLMKRKVRERWSVEKTSTGYVYKERVHPLEPYLRRRSGRDAMHRVTSSVTDEVQAVPESSAVIRARKAWDDAKASGDPDAMTRAANNLLRAVEADRALRGESAPANDGGARHSTSEVLAPEDGRNAIEQVALHEAQGAIGRAFDHTVGDLLLSPAGEAKDDAMIGVDRVVADSVADDWLSRTYEHLQDDAGSLDKLGDRELGMHNSARIELSQLQQREASHHTPEARGLDDDTGDADPERSKRERSQIADETGAHVQSILGEREDTREDVRELQYAAGAGDEYPDQPGAGLERVKRAERAGARRERRRGWRHWVDPQVGWSQPNANATLAAAAGKPLTVEALLIWSHEVYMEERGDLLPSQRLPPGWEKVDEINDEESGYYAIAVRDKLTGTVVIINRGTSLLDKGDRVASFDILAGRDTRQLMLARAFLVRVFEINKRTGKSGKFIVTGHSLGSACAQVQLAAAYYDRRLRGRLTDISGVGFSSLGAKDTIAAIQRADKNWWGIDPRGFEPFAGDRFVTYTRRGDGIVVDRARKRGKRESLGDAVWLDAIDEEGLAADEASLQKEPSWWGNEASDATVGATSLRIQNRYIRNHSLRSMYHPEFLDPLDRVLERRRSRRRQGVH